MNVLGLDYGKRWVGTAVGNTEEGFAVPLETIERTLDESLFQTIRAVCQERTIGRIVIGMPLTMQAQVGERAQEVRAFAEKIEQEIGLPVSLVDERLTSRMARSEKGGGGDEHTRAAALILETFLNKRE